MKKKLVQGLDYLLHLIYQYYKTSENEIAQLTRWIFYEPSHRITALFLTVSLTSVVVLNVPRLTDHSDYHSDYHSEYSLRHKQRVKPPVRANQKSRTSIVLPSYLERNHLKQPPKMCFRDFFIRLFYHGTVFINMILRRR